MNNQIIDEFDKASLIKEIHERDIIICNYQKCGFLDRDDAIRKIQELRKGDKDIATATVVNLSVYSPNTSRFIKLPQRPMICPRINPGTHRSPSRNGLIFLILQ